MFYNLTIGTDHENFVLTYELENHRPAQIWASLIQNQSKHNLRKNLDPWRGKTSQWDQKISRLNDLIAELNLWMPSKISGTWNYSDPYESLNRLHQHFPEQERVETDTVKRSQLTEYNDLIHEIEFMYHAKKDHVDKIYMLCCFENNDRVRLADSDFKHFQIHREFGDLLLHYPHVGRHPLELAVQNDTACPADQIVCQSEISADHSLRFSDFKPEKSQFENFYKNSGLCWPYEINDPRLAIGYIKLGSLSRINNQVLQKEQILEIISKSNIIIDWTISL